MSLHLLAWTKKAWHLPSGRQVLAPFSTQPLPLAPTPGAAQLIPPPCAHCPPSAAQALLCRRSPLTPALLTSRWHLLTSRQHLLTSTSRQHLPTVASFPWERTEGISRSHKRSSQAAPCHSQFPKALFFRKTISLPTTRSPSPLFTPEFVLSPFRPPRLYKWQSSRVTCQLFFFAALPQVGSGHVWGLCAIPSHGTIPAKLQAACCCGGKGEHRHRKAC